MPNDFQNSCLKSHLSKKFSRSTTLLGCNVSRSARSDNLATASTALRTDVDEVVGNLYYIEVMLDDDGRIAAIDQLVDYAQQLANILKMETRRRLIQDVKRAARIGFRKFGREFYTLALTAR